MLYLLLISIIFASLNSVVLHKADLSNGNTVYKINMIVSAVWFFVLFAVNGFKISISSPALIWGIVYGVTQTLFILFKTLAMNSGPVSVTTLIGNMSLVVSVFFCFFVWQEAIAASDIIGLAVLMLGTVLTTYKNKKDGKKISRKWIIYSIFFLIFAASVGISFKAFGKTGHSDVAGDMMIIASILLLPGKGLQDVIYGYIQMVTFSYMVDALLTGSKQSVQIFIFSSKFKEVADMLITKMDRGVTALHSEGWYSHQESRLLVVVARKEQLNQIKVAIMEVDPKAFITVSSVMGVYGRGFDQIKGHRDDKKKFTLFKGKGSDSKVVKE